MTQIKEYSELIKKTILSDYKGMLKEPGGYCKYKYITPGSAQYATELWDWDSWMTDIALRQIMAINADEQEKAELLEYEKGCWKRNL